MKISVIHNRQDKPEQSDYVEVHYSDLDKIDNAIATHIKIVDCVDYVDSPESLINMAVKKMRYGSELIIIGNDVFCIADKILSGMTDINDMRSSLYSGRRSISHYEHIKRILEQYGLNIELCNLDKTTNKYMIIARKPNV